MALAASAIGGEAIGIHGVDADELADAVVLGLHHFPRIGQGAANLIPARQVDAAAGGLEAQHGAGIGAVGRDAGAVEQLHVGEEALVAPNEAAFDQRGGKAHRSP
jgi:hypothetical protein